MIEGEGLFVATKNHQSYYWWTYALIENTEMKNKPNIML